MFAAALVTHDAAITKSVSNFIAAVFWCRPQYSLIVRARLRHDWRRAVLLFTVSHCSIIIVSNPDGIGVLNADKEIAKYSDKVSAIDAYALAADEKNS